jgi:glutamate formiminotransferase
VLLAVPNISEGRDRELVVAIARAFAPWRLLDLHLDPDHNRSVLSLAAPYGSEALGGLKGGVERALATLDLGRHEGVHPRVGAVDVLPIVYADTTARPKAQALALTAAALIGEELELPTFLYGELATAPGRRERAELRRGGPALLARRMAAGELRPDFGPLRLHPRGGALLVTARPPLVAFNVELASDDVEQARRIASELREAGGGPAGLRAIGVPLRSRGRAQVSFNVHDPLSLPLAEIVASVRARAPVAAAEIVGLVPSAALDGFPPDVPLRGFDPERQILERALALAADD